MSHIEINAAQTGESRFITATDGLRLHYREYAPRAASARVPLVCLPGLARTADDFNVLARAISQGDGGPNRRVVALDYRGRGLSDRDRNWRNYDMRTENNDILSVLAAAEIERAIFLGTSRGGLHTMMLTATRPAVIRAAILNDIGPVIEPKGLMRIRGYVGKLPSPGSWNDAADMARQIMGAQFTGLSDEEWRTYAQLTFEEKEGRFLPRYDLNLSKPLAAMNLEAALPALWPQFKGLRHVPVLAIRGANSDLLSQETLVEMTRRHSRCESYIVPGQGHAPLLLDAPSIARIQNFLARVDAG